MANLVFTQIRTHPQDTLAYIANKDKILSDQVHDIYRVLNYMGSPQSVERIFTFSRHCSQNPQLATQEISLHQEMYYQSKKNAKRKKGELLGLHFILSYSIQDAPPVEVMTEIMQKLAEHPLLKDFATLGAHHFDKPHRHSHFYTSQFSAVGKPRKMGLHYDDIWELMRYSNRLCVERGLSIIDKSELRKDQAYSDWLDGVIAEGRVTVHSEKKVKRSRSKKSVPTKNHYYRWMQEKQEREDAEVSVLTPKERNKKAFDETYFYTMDGDPERRWYVSGDLQRRFYVVRLDSDDGYRRSTLELAIRLVLLIAKDEGDYIRHEDIETWIKFNAKVDKKLQGMCDYLSTAQKLNVQKTEQITERLADIGKQMNVLKCDKARHEKSIAKSSEIIEAYQTYTRSRTVLDGATEPDTTVESEYKLLLENQILTPEACYELYKRRDFEMRKIADYERRMLELNRQYRELKKLEALAVHMTNYVHEIYSYSDLAHKRAMAREDGGVDSIIDSARARVDRHVPIDGKAKVL